MPHATGVSAANSIAGNDSRGAMDDRDRGAMPAWRAGSAADPNEQEIPLRSERIRPHAPAAADAPSSPTAAGPARTQSLENNRRGRPRAAAFA
jgi:hypothetical protein